MAIDGTVAEGIATVREVRQRIVDLVDQQGLAASKASYDFQDALARLIH